MFSFIKKVFLRKHKTGADVDKLFNFMAMLTKQEQAVENYLYRYDRLHRKAQKHGDKVLIELYLSWEEFIVNNSAASGEKTSKEDIRKKISTQINIENLSQHFRLVFVEERVQLSYLYSILLIELAEYVHGNLGNKVLHNILREAGADTIFQNINITDGKVNLDSIHNLIKIHPAEYPANSIIQIYKAFISSFYNKIELSLGEEIVQGIFRKLYENFKNTYNTEFATLLLKITPEKVLGLNEWLSLLSKSELEKQVKEKTEELEDLNESLEARVRERTEELKKAYEELKELDKKKTEFISVAAHQIRTPVSGIKWIINMLLQEEVGSLSSDQKNFLQKAYTANERLLSIVNNLLDIDLINTDQAVYEFKEVDVFDLINKTIANLAAQANAKNIKIVWNKENKDTSNAGIIEADEKRFQSVLDNLIDNAIKYSSENDTVTIDTQRDEEDLTISIKDTGVGIPKDSETDIFKRFYRAPNAIRIHADGSGLGLFIAQNIIKRHNGIITFISDENKGSAFTISIPTTHTDEI